MEKETVDFESLDVGDRFCIPSHLDHDMEWFVKLPFNKAGSDCFMFE